MRRSSQIFYAGMLVLCASLWTADRAQAQSIAHLTSWYQSQQPEYGHTIHSGIIAIPGVVRYSSPNAASVALNGAYKRWAVYDDQLDVMPVEGDGEWCQDCQVVSKTQACAIVKQAASHTAHAANFGAPEPRMVSGTMLCSKCGQQCGPSAAATTYLVAATATCASANNGILASWPLPLAFMQSLTGCPSWTSALVGSDGIVKSTTNKGAFAPLHTWMSPRPEVMSNKNLATCGYSDPFHAEFQGPAARMEQEARNFALCHPGKARSHLPTFDPPPPPNSFPVPPENMNYLLWNPILATLDLLSVPATTLRDIWTNHGFYTFAVGGLVGTQYTVTGKMRFAPFTTRLGSAKTYWLGDTSGTIGYNFYTNMPLNLKMLTGLMHLENDNGEPVKTVRDDNFPPDSWDEGQTRFAAWTPLGVVDNPGQPLPQGPAAMPWHEVLKQIDQGDLRDTAIYVYREADGQLIGSRWGLGNVELGCGGVRGAPPDYQGVCDRTIGYGASYQLLVRGHGANTRYRSRATCVDATIRASADNPSDGPGPCENYVEGQVMEQAAAGVELRYSSSATAAERGIRGDEPLRVVLINQASGYMSTLRTGNERTWNDTATVYLESAVLRPPRLRIWAERKAANDNQIYQIGSEGSGLTSDERILIYTEWLDQDGTPLPEGLMMTGRVALSAAPNAGGNRLSPVPSQPVTVYEQDYVGNPVAVHAMGQGQFPIRPGFHAVMIVVPKADVQSAKHLYVHVDGTNPKLLGGSDDEVKPVEPDFSTKQVCFKAERRIDDVPTIVTECRARDPEEPESFAMLERPWRHVPILVPYFRKEYGAYEWMRRPEYHISLLELKDVKLTTTGTDGSKHEIDVTKPGGRLLTTDARLDLVYTLGTKSDEELIRFSGARTLSWVLNNAAQAHTGADGVSTSVGFENPGRVTSDTGALAVRLVQDKDEANVLWKYTFRSINFHLEKRKTSLKVGETTQVIAKTVPEAMDVTWAITKKDSEAIKVQIVPGIDSKHIKLRVDRKSAEGFIRLKATGREIGPDAASTSPVSVEKNIFVGCECEHCIVPGAIVCELDSVHARWGVGKGEGGDSAGTLSIEGDQLGQELATPSALRFDSLNDTDVTVVKAGGAIRQILAPDILVDVVTQSATAYQLRFYPSFAAGAADAQNVRAIQQGVQPIAEWTVSGGAQGLDIQGHENGHERRFEFRKDNDVWSLGRGETSVEQRESLQQQTVGADRIERRRIMDANGTVKSDVSSTFRTLGFGEALVMQVEDPDGVARTTRYSYFDNETAGQRGRVQTVEYPDGSWTSYAYDSEGRVSVETSPWLDAPVTAPANQVRRVTYDYSAVDPREYAGGSYASAWGAVSLAIPSGGLKDPDRPRTVVESVGGVEVSRTYYAQLTGAGGSQIDISERAAAQGAGYGATGNLRTVTLYGKRSSDRDELLVQGVEYPDGRVDRYETVNGYWSTGAFTPYAGGLSRQVTVDHAHREQLSGVPGKSTREVRVEDGHRNAVREESWVQAGNAFVLASWTNNTYDDNGRLTHSLRSNGTETSASWGCCGYDSQTDEQGITTTYTYDGLGRVRTEQRLGVTTTHIYDAAGRETETRRSSSSGTLTTKRSYDSGGRLETSTDEAGLVTGYAYSSDGRTTTVTRPGGFTEVSQQYADGQTVSVTGTGVVAQYTSHSVAPDGSRITETRAGSAASAQFERTVSDMLGRTLRTERPAFSGGLDVSESFYNSKGQLVRQTQSGSPATLFAYDLLGNATRTVQDVDGNGSIDLAGSDRVQEQDSSYVLRDGAPWQESVQRVYASAGSSTPVTVSTQRSRVGGFSGGLVAETQSVDMHGNVTSSRTLLNAEGATITQLVDVPDSDTDQVTITVQGQTMASIGSSGLTTAFTYDGFSRRTGVVDGRTGTSATHYDAAGRVDWVEDAQHHRTAFAYEATTGRKIGEVNALAKVTRFAYNARGELVRTWGDVPYPVEYGYDAQGRRTSMRTYREALAWNAETWPAAASGDATTWEYHPASGLLAAKRDAAGQAVQYTYGPGGKLSTRRWARTLSGNPLVTTYGYDPATGDLATVDYSDTTPDVSFAYDRLGRSLQVSDGSGTHTFGYNATTLALETETRAGLVPATLTYKHATSGVTGRATGIRLGSSYDVTYGYDPKGRLANVGWSVSGQTDNVTYNRVPGSELLGGLIYGSGVTTTYGYEPQRDLKTQVKNVAGGATVSQYDYQYDAIGRRTSVLNTGSAFAQSAFSKWNYNDRNELIDSGRYRGTSVSDTSNPVTAEHRAYGFDPIGNRQTATEGTTSKSYAPNALNEYASVGGVTYGYDVDGNLINDGARKFTYDGENRLVRVEPVTAANGGVRVTMAYDYLGRRVQKVVEEYDGGAWEAQDDVRFVYLGWNVVEERQATAGVNTKKNFAWGLDLSQSIDGAGGIGGLLAVVDEQGSQMSFLYDANGNVGQLVDEGGAVVAKYEYDPFGQVLVANGAVADGNAWRFSTKMADVETGLVYYGYRFYSPEMGRWVNRDPAGEDVGGMNLYVMVMNRPVDRTDTLGLVLRSSDTCIESYLKKYLTDFDRSGSWLGLAGPYDYSDGRGSKTDPLIAEILRGMMASKTVFSLRDSSSGCTASLKEHVEARLQVIRNTESAQFGFGVGKDEHRNWTIPGQEGTTDPKVIYEALNNPDTKLGCAFGAEVCYYAATGEYHGNTLGRDLERSVFPSAVWIPGDLGFIKNDIPAKYTRVGESGENVIYVGLSGGRKMFWGNSNSVRVRSEQDWMLTVGSWKGTDGRPGRARWRLEVEYPSNGLASH